MERWTALARLTDAPGGSPRGRADLRKIRPEITGPQFAGGPARLPALHRGVFLAAPGRAFGSALEALPSASSWRGTVVSPGGAPTQPGGAACEAAPAGAAPVRGPE